MQMLRCEALALGFAVHRKWHRWLGQCAQFLQARQQRIAPGVTCAVVHVHRGWVSAIGSQPWLARLQQCQKRRHAHAGGHPHLLAMAGTLAVKAAIGARTAPVS